MKHYNRQSTRLRDFDYRGGEYHVVICCADRLPLLGEVVGGGMVCNELGRYVEVCLESIPQHTPYASVPVFQVMPNHVHAIVCIENNSFSHPTTLFEEGIVLEPFEEDNLARDITPQKGQLATVIRSFKAAVSHWSRQHDIPFSWQRGYYDHLIRCRSELDKTIDYIIQNPTAWERDCYYLCIPSILRY